MKRIETQFIPGRDKAMHFATGALGGFLATLFAISMKVPPDWTIAAGVGLGVVAGIGKEVYDYYHPEVHSAEVWDAVCTIAGSFVGALCAHLVRF